MRKSLLLLVVAMLLPVFAMADNMALSKTVANYSTSSKAAPRVQLPATVLGVTSLPEDENTEIAYSIGEWVKVTAVQAQSGVETGAILMSYNTWKQMNQNGVWAIHCDANGTLTGKGFGAGNGGLFGLGMPSALGSITLNEWHYVMLVVDNANAKAAFYIDGVKTQSGNLTGKVRYIWDDCNVQFWGWGCGGALDEINIYHKALTDEEAATSYISAKAVSGLAAQYTFDEVKAGSTGLFANQVTTGAAADIDATYANVTYNGLWAQGGFVDASTDGVETAPTLVDGREIAFDVNVSLEQAEGGVLTVTSGTNSWYGDDEFTVTAGSTLHFAAVPEEGYEVMGIFVTSLTTGETTQLANNSDYVVTGDIMISVVYSNNLHTLTVNKPDDVTISLVAGGVELTDYTKVIDDTDYTLTVTVPEAKKLTAVTLDGTALTAAANGTYTINLTADATLEITVAEKANYTVTINQPAAGGRVIVTKGTSELANGATVAEGTVLALSNEPATHYTFVNYVVNGTNTTSTSVTVNADVTISAVFEEAAEAEYNAPTGSSAGSSAYLKTITTTGAKTDLNITHTGLNQTSTAYEHCSHATLEVTPGSEFDLTLTANKLSTSTSVAYQDLRYCVAYIFEDFDGDGVFTFVDRFGNFENESTFTNRAGTSFTWGGNVKANYDNVMTITQHMTVPADARIGNCRIRVIYTEAWDTVAKAATDKIISGDYQSINKGVAYDFDVTVVKAMLDEERTVTVASNNEALGTVAINGTAEKTITTSESRVLVEATATEGTFVNWTDNAGRVVATTTSYGYTGTEDVELTANFGCALTYSYTGDGSLAFTTADGSAHNNDVLDYGTEVTLTLTPGQGQRVESVYVNGVNQTVEGNQVTFTMEKNTNVTVAFAEATFAVTWTVQGNGTVRAFAEWGDNLDDLVAAGEIHSGDMMPSSGEIFFIFIPENGNDLTSVVFESGASTDEWVSTDFENNSDTPIEGIESDVYYSSIVYVADMIDGDDMTISVTFDPTGSAINEILGDEANGNVEYYNLQGVKVAADNLTPGIYVARNGNKAVKVLVK